MIRVAPARAALVALYCVLAVMGLVGTWAYNLRFFATSGGDYVAAWFANPASSSAAVDVIVTAVVGSVVIVVEGWRIGWRWSAVLVPLIFLIALAFVLPLFLAVREVLLASRKSAEGVAG